MGEDIRAGDVVVCINARPAWIVAEPALSAFKRLEQGRFYRVERWGQNDSGKTGIDIGVPNSDLWGGFADIWPAQCFRKLPPASEEFTEQMRACRPAKQREPV